MKLIDKLKQNSTLEVAETLEKSVFYTERDVVKTDIPLMNVGLSGQIDGGLTPGVGILAGPSKHFKSGFAVCLAAAYMKQYPDAAMLFYDSEFGMPIGYFEMFGVDQERVLHCPVTDVEELKHDTVNQLKQLKRGEKVIVITDSIGNIASRKELDDAESGKVVADMSRAKSIKSYFRMVTPKVNLLGIPMIVVNHTYETLEMYSKQMMGGGTGPYYSANWIWFLGRQQDKDTQDNLQGYNFIINIEKSRFVKEKSRLPINVNFETGIQKWAGFFDLAVAMGYIEKISPQKYQFGEKEFKKKDVEFDNYFWESLINDTDIDLAIKKTYQLSSDKSGAITQVVEENNEE